MFLIFFPFFHYLYMHNSFLFAFTMKKSSIFSLHRHVNSHTVADSISAIVLMSRLCFPNLNIWRNSYTNLSVGTNSDGCQALVGCDTKEWVRAPPLLIIINLWTNPGGKSRTVHACKTKQASFHVIVLTKEPPLSCFYRWADNTEVPKY